MSSPGPYLLHQTYVHLSYGGAAQPLSVDEEFWPKLMAGAFGLDDGRLLSRISFEASWTKWEVHPHGEEIVMLLSGAVDFFLEEADGPRRMIELREPGSFVIVPRGAWHTARILEPADAIFITPGHGTQHRPLVDGDFA